MTTPTTPLLRPERAEADKAVLAEAVRLSGESRPRRTLAGIFARRSETHRRPRLVPLSLLATLVVVAAVVVFSTLTAPATRPPSASAKSPSGWVLLGDVSPTWQTVASTPYQPQFGLPGIGFSCPTTTTCYAVNFENPGPDGASEVVVTTNGGATWSPSTLPVTLTGPGPAALSCVDANTCALLGVNSAGSPIFLETTDGGATWQQEAGPTGLGASFGTRLVCSSASTCVGVTGGGGPVTATKSLVTASEQSPFAFATSDGGATWTTSSLPSGFVPGDLQCSSADDCVASGGGAAGIVGSGAGFAYTTDGGATWTSTSVNESTVFGGMRRLSCNSSNTCLADVTSPNAGTSSLLSSSDGGATWSSVTPTGLPEGFVTTLLCTTGNTCWAGGITNTDPMVSAVSLGAPGFVASTTDGGTTWQSSPLPSGVGAVMEVSCPSSTACFALAVAQGQPAGTTAGFELLAYASSATTDG
jgi:hypothetical protein